MSSDNVTRTVTELAPGGGGQPAVKGVRHQVVVMVGPLLSAYTVAHASLVIGRSHQADIQVIDSSISRHHLRLSFGPPLTAEDLNSRNGSFADGQRLLPGVPTEIASGVPIGVGNASLLVRQIADTPQPPEVSVRFPPSLEKRPAGSASGIENLAIGPNASWFCLSGGPRVDLTRHPTLRRLLFTFVFNRLRAPGEPISPDDLIAAVWPDKRSSRDALRNRLYASLSRLRTQGLDKIIQRKPKGYCLSGEVRVDQHT